MSVTNRGLNDNVVKTKLDELFFETYDKKKLMGHTDHTDAVLFNQDSMKQKSKVEALLKGIGDFNGVEEEGSIAGDTFQDGPVKTTTAIKYAKALEITEELREDDGWGVVMNQVKQMGRKARLTQDQNAFEIYRGAFTVTPTAHAGKFLCDSTNTTLSGDVVDNSLTGAFSETTVDDMMKSLYKQVSHDGTLEGQVPSSLLIPTDLWKKATVLLDTEKVPGSNNNDINIYSNKFDIALKTTVYLGTGVQAAVASGTIPAVTVGSDTAFFLLGDEHLINRYERSPLTTNYRGEEYSNNEVAKYKARFREAYGAVDFLGIVGSTGL